MHESSTNLGHGMGESPEVKDWLDITIQDIAQLSDFYPQLQGSCNILWRSPRPFSSAALVQFDKIIYFIKRSHCSFRRSLDLKQEHQFIQYLEKQGIPVPLIQFTKNGDTAIELGGWSYEVHAKANGLDLYADQLSWKPFFNAQHAARSGKMLAKMHQAAREYPIKHGRYAQYLISNQDLLESDDIVQSIQKRIQNSQALSQYFADKILDPIWLNQLSKIHHKIKHVIQNAPKIWTHNDLHASNLLWSENTDQAEISTVIDFGLADYNSAIYDLAVAIERNFIDWLALEKTTDIHVDWIGLEAFLEAYMTQAVNLEEIKILPDLIKIVHTDFALSELEYFVGITRNIQHADAAYYHWLISHTAWFHQPQGQLFCQKLADLIHQVRV